MNGFFESLRELSIEELENVITKAQELIQEKHQQAQRQAELEKQRLEQERLEAERKKREEIAELQRRLRELQADIENDGQENAQENTQERMPEPALELPVGAKSEEIISTTSQDQGYSMMSCPECHKLIPSDSRFCFYCGSDTTQKKESEANASSVSDSESPEQPFIICPNCSTQVPSDSRFCHNCGKPVGSAN